MQHLQDLNFKAANNRILIITYFYSKCTHGIFNLPNDISCRRNFSEEATIVKIILTFSDVSIAKYISGRITGCQAKIAFAPNVAAIQINFTKPLQIQKIHRPLISKRLSGVILIFNGAPMPSLSR